eukprot:gene4917-5564_t
MAASKTVPKTNQTELESCVGKSQVRKHGLNPIAKALLEGIYDTNCELNKLFGIYHVLRAIWTNVTDFWKSNILIHKRLDPLERNLEGTTAYLNLNSQSYEQSEPESVVKYRDEPYIDNEVVFPPADGININMMPFLMNETFSECRLPERLRHYWENLVRFCLLESEQLGKVGYLTIQESFVEKNSSQRRPGLHTERPGLVRLNFPAAEDIAAEGTDNSGGSSCGSGSSVIRRYSFGWGGGNWSRPVSEQPELEGGIYMASNVNESCKVYNCEIINDDLIGELGDIEHLREFMPEGDTMKKDCLYWITDRTPHESLPLKESTTRQFFRLVTKDVSLWYKDHSTKNPLGVVPDPEITRIVKGSKFDKNGVVLADEREPVSKSRLKKSIKSLNIT